MWGTGKSGKQETRNVEQQPRDRRQELWMRNRNKRDEGKETRDVDSKRGMETVNDGWGIQKEGVRDRKQGMRDRKEGCGTGGTEDSKGDMRYRKRRMKQETRSGKQETRGGGQ